MKPLKDVDQLGEAIGSDALLAVLQSQTVPFEGVDEIDPLSVTVASAGEDWVRHFSAGVVSASELHRMELPHHQVLLDRWFAEGDLGLIFAARGVGKTHLGIGIARAMAEGSSIGPWRAHRAVPVLYVDGEMNAEQIRDRDAALTKGDGQIHYLNHRTPFRRHRKAAQSCAA